MNATREEAPGALWTGIGCMILTAIIVFVFGMAVIDARQEAASLQMGVYDNSSTSEWFNPAWSHTHLDIDRVLREQWVIGNRMYRTKDLMGQRIAYGMASD